MSTPPPTAGAAAAATGTMGTAGTGTAASVAAASGTYSSAPTSNTNTATAAANTAADDRVPAPSDDAVLSYLRKRGLGGAAVELSRVLRAEKKRKEREEAEEEAGARAGGGDGDEDDDGDDDDDEHRARNQRTALALSTGGGLGYDLDSAPAIALWGGSFPTATAGATAAASAAAAAAARFRGGGVGRVDKDPVGEAEERGQEEARRFVESFTALQTWVLSLPDDAPGTVAAGAGAGAAGAGAPPPPSVASVLRHAQAAGGRNGGGGGKAMAKAGDASASGGGGGEEVHVIPGASAPPAEANAPTAAAAAAAHPHHHQRQQPPPPYYPTSPHAPPSSKPELLSVAFPLLIHTYCELLESGLEATAAALLSTYRAVHTPTYAAELGDCDLCATTDHVVDLNANIGAHTDALAEARQVRASVHGFRKKKAGLAAAANAAGPSGGSASAESQSRIIDSELGKLEVRYRDLTRRASRISARLAALPFLRRARALRWQISLSSAAYGLLASYLSSGGGKLLPMSALLQSRCHINVERRDPVGVIPGVVLEDMILGSSSKGEDDEAGGDDGGDDAKLAPKEDDVRWAAPVDPLSRSAEAGEDVLYDAAGGGGVGTRRSILSQPESLPFPKFYLDPDAVHDTQDSADAERRRVEFNRALLANGFRRLEALECKREYEIGMRRPAAVRSSTGAAGTNKVGAAGGGAGGGANVIEEEEDDEDSSREYANPHAPSVLLSTLCAARPSSGPSWSYGTASAAAAASGVTGGAGTDGGVLAGLLPTLQESGIDVCCARLCMPDGRRVAVGCDDAAVRIWTMDSSSGGIGGGAGSETGSNKDVTDGTADESSSKKAEESALVLLGHKNGFPVFDLDWNRDGRTLLSAGGDGSVRLWDTAAVGPFGRLANVVRRHASGAANSTVTSTAQGSSTNAPSKAKATVPGYHTESLVEVSGAALATYRGHSPSTPIWSVSFAPSGYYFASAGWDSTARIWTTDRPTPVRILAGHFSSSVNCVTWHPNCNYVVTGGDDGTCRMWDVQTGRCVRLLSGANGGSGVNLVRVCPSGKYAAGSDYGGTVHIWDLGSGRKVNELRVPTAEGGSTGGAKTIHSMSYSACGTALATGGDDCTVRIWDVRGAGSHMSDAAYAKSQGWSEGGMLSVPGASAGVQPTEEQLARRPFGERFRPGMRAPVKTFRTRRTIILDLQYTKRNLLLSVGKYSGSAM